MPDLTQLKVSIEDECIVSRMPASCRRREQTGDGDGSVQMYEATAIVERAPLTGVANVFLVSFVFHDGAAQHWNIFTARKEADDAFYNLMNIHKGSS